MAATISVWIFCYQNGNILAPTAVRVPLDAEYSDLQYALASRLGIPLTSPKWFLQRGDAGAGDLRSRLLDHKGQLNAFCFELSGEDWGDWTVSQMLSPSNETPPSRARQSKVTCLIAALQPAQAAVAPQDALEGIEGEAQDVLTQLVKPFRNSQTLRREMPSKSAKTPVYFNHQNGAAPILDGRYADDRTPLALPVEIYHPVFAKFYARSRDETLDPPPDLVVETSNFMVYSSKIQTQEVLRQYTRTHLSKLLSIVVDLHINDNGTRPNHSITYDRETEPMVRVSLAIVEEKAELGQSGEPTVQASFSYIEHWNQPDRLPILEACFCPSFIVAVAGAWACVAGAIYTTHPVVHRLSPYIWTAESRLVDDLSARRLARVFHALGLALAELREWYKALKAPQGGLDRSRFFPLANQCRLENGDILTFRYLKPLKQLDEGCVTFLAADAQNAERLLVVKFVERYGADVHRALAQHALAPQLLYFGSIWLDETAQNGVEGRKMVVMEFVKGQTSSQKYGSKPPQNVYQAVAKALKILRDGGMVHGDIRAPNIMIVDGDGDDDKRTRIIDFDWAGKAGEVRYPLHLSEVVNWAGATSYGLIEADHDEGMLKQLE